MYRHLAALSIIPLTLLLAACDSSQPPASTPAATTPAATPAATAPASPTTRPGNAALEPLIGAWASTPANCGAPITIAANSFKSAENSCEISGWTDNGDGTYTAAMSCNSQGQKITMTPLFGPQGEGIRLAYNGRGGEPVTVFRCSKPKAQ